MKDLEIAKRLIDLYELDLRVWAVERTDSKWNGDQISEEEWKRHCRWMLAEMRGMTDVAKLNRWLGFVQGVLVITGMYSIDDVREHVLAASKEPGKVVSASACLTAEDPQTRP